MRPTVVIPGLSDQALAAIVVSRSPEVARQAWAVLQERQADPGALEFIALNSPNKMHRDTAVRNLADREDVNLNVLRSAAKGASSGLRRQLLSRLMDGR